MASDSTYAVWIACVQREELALFWEKQGIALGPKPLGDLKKLPSDRDKFKTQVSAALGNISANWLQRYADQCFEFAITVKIGDHLVVRAPGELYFLVGAIEGEYRFRPLEFSPYEHVRSVEWIGKILANRFPLGLLQEVTSVAEFSNLQNNAKEMKSFIRRLYR
jgi:restriction system protein